MIRDLSPNLTEMLALPSAQIPLVQRTADTKIHIQKCHSPMRFLRRCDLYSCVKVLIWKCFRQLFSLFFAVVVKSFHLLSLMTIMVHCGLFALLCFALFFVSFLLLFVQKCHNPYAQSDTNRSICFLTIA